MRRFLSNTWAIVQTLFYIRCTTLTITGDSRALIQQSICLLDDIWTVLEQPLVFYEDVRRFENCKSRLHRKATSVRLTQKYEIAVEGSQEVHKSPWSSNDCSQVGQKSQWTPWTPSSFEQVQKFGNGGRMVARETDCSMVVERWQEGRRMKVQHCTMEAHKLLHGHREFGAWIEVILHCHHCKSYVQCFCFDCASVLQSIACIERFTIDDYAAYTQRLWHPPWHPSAS